MKTAVWILVCAGILFMGCEGKLRGGRTSIEPLELVEPTHIELMIYANEGMLNNYEAAIDRFNDVVEDVQVVIQNVYGEDWSDFDRTFKSYVHGGSVPDIVDISVIYRDSLIRQGMLKDLMPVARARDMDFDLFFDNQFNGLIIDDALYGIPSGALLMAAYVNKDLFREAGVALPSADWSDTWDRQDFAEAARRIAALSSDGNDVYGLAQSYTIGWIIPHIMASGSPFLSEPNAVCTGDDAGFIDTISYLGDLMFIDGVSPAMMDMVNLQPYQYFMDGHVGIFIDGNWWMEGFRDSAEFDWGVVPMPMDAISATGMYVDCWSVPDISDNGEEAFQVLEFFLAEDQQRSGIMKGIPPLKSAARDIYRERFPDLSDEEISVWFDGIAYGRVPAYFDAWSQFQDETTDILLRQGLGDLTGTEAAGQICASYRAAQTEGVN